MRGLRTALPQGDRDAIVRNALGRGREVESARDGRRHALHRARPFRLHQIGVLRNAPVGADIVPKQRPQVEVTVHEHQVARLRRAIYKCRHWLEAVALGAHELLRNGDR